MASSESLQESILIVEDAQMLLSVAAETLRDVGYVVREAADGDSAMAMLRQHADIALLISDIQMPGMSGYESARAAMKLCPQLKILLMTGYAKDPIPEELSEAGIDVLHKPFNFETLPLLADHLLKSGLRPNRPAERK